MLDIAFDFRAENSEHRPYIRANPELITMLDLEFAAQFIASWSKAVWGLTEVLLDPKEKEQIVTFNLMNELNEHSFVAFQRMEILLRNLAHLIGTALQTEVQD